ncbi:FAD-dependent thymidylate synthase [Deinococcus maricopensis]|uniref:Flavin-dependent thymidylate synthase n=1 Tax=Deinococcus maricopensis (strain DSM 21211 / LMG 22137 / NRRL B-23946 / LB-34) TaxID=709986 RepID=E8UC26_DEIML|nr:FAD-dependent thymidylate synthase [Deinococcus maricopensis]ADV68687.1 Thymidylate synthase thyX [Deinococcus maricopensis DSM 21211]
MSSVKNIKVMVDTLDAQHPAPADPQAQQLYPLGDGIGSVALVQHIGDDKMIVNAARVSFGGDNTKPLDARDEKLLRYLLREHHGSPFEHNLITFKVVCPIFVDRQMVRHRVGVSKNEISGRYVEMQERGYQPTEFRKQAPSNRQASVEDDGTLDQGKAAQVWADAWRNAFGAYQDLLTLGVTREQARGVLPQALYTESYYTFNVRSLLHFLELRDHNGAQYETRLYARAMAELAEPLFPVTFSAWRELQKH